MENIATMVAKQRTFFFKQQPFSLEYRLAGLHRLKAMLKENEKELLNAVYKDLHKPAQETMATELLSLLDEIHFVCRHLAAWIKPKRVAGVFPFWLLSQSFRYVEPYGVVLIISPWNYPLLLTLSPLIGALAAGNCVILKPSPQAVHTEALLEELVRHYFDPLHVTLVRGEASEIQTLIASHPDYIFFTGSYTVGKAILGQAAAFLIPVTLELGGKSPVIVDETANIKLTAKQIAWAKTLNAGQTCIAPDYLYVAETVKERLIAAIIVEFKRFFGSNIKNSPDFGRIISEQQCEKLVRLLLSGGTIRFGGAYQINEKFIEPTLLDNISFNDAIMQEEIFGPILPILTFTEIEEAILNLQGRAKPLALYYFTQRKERAQRLLTQLSFGGGAINDCTMQVRNWHLPFGGVGLSGMGAYHGRYSFDTFSHYKSIYKRTSCFPYPLLYPPYSKAGLQWLKKLLGW